MNQDNSPHRYSSPAVTAAAIIIIIAGLMQATSIVTPILLALFVSIICAQPVNWLARKKIPHGLAVVIVLLLIIFIFLGLGRVIGGSLSEFSQDAPKYAASLTKMEASFFQYLQEKGIDLADYELKKLLDPGKIITFTASILGELGALMSNMALIFFIVIFILIELGSFTVKARAISRKPVETLEYLASISQSIRHYMSIKTLIGLMTGGFIWIWLTILGVDYAVLWALLGFLLNYIPNIGSIIAGVPTVLFALVQLGLGGALWTAVGYVTVNMVIGNVIEPKIMGKGMGLSTLVVFLALIVWGFVLGTVGMFLSVPLTMTMKIILQQNPRTRWIAILLGTQEDAQLLLDDNNKSRIPAA